MTLCDLKEYLAQRRKDRKGKPAVISNSSAMLRINSERNPWARPQPTYPPAFAREISYSSCPSSLVVKCLFLLPSGRFLSCNRRRIHVPLPSCSLLNTKSAVRQKPSTRKFGSTIKVPGSIFLLPFSATRLWRIPPISSGTCETSHVISNEVRNLSYLDHDRIGKISRYARDDNNKIKAAIDRRMPDANLELEQ
jgi:hypothetical protein